MPKVLIVEDDVRLARVIDDWLTGESYAVDHVTSGPAALERLKAAQYDVLILCGGVSQGKKDFIPKQEIFF